MLRNLLIILCFFGIKSNCLSQETETVSVMKNQVSMNVGYLLFGSPNITYERVLSNHFAIGLSTSIYGNSHQNLNLESFGEDYKINYDFEPFGRWYINGTQRKSHFLEFFGSINESERRGRNVRITNDEGYGVYIIDNEKTTNVGLGTGYGYRFLLIDKKLVLEAQVALRTNFIVDYFFFDVAIVRTGIKVGYRF